MADWTEDKARGCLGPDLVLCRGAGPQEVAASLQGRGYGIPSMSLFIATYIYTYSGDAPMNARWIDLSWMETKQKHHNKPLQINWPKEAVLTNSDGIFLVFLYRPVMLSPEFCSQREISKLGQAQTKIDSIPWFIEKEKQK